MDSHRLASVFTGLRLGLHTVVGVIVLIVVVRALPPAGPRAWVGLVAVLAWALAYAAGVADGARRARRRAAPVGGTTPGGPAGATVGGATVAGTTPGGAAGATTGRTPVVGTTPVGSTGAEGADSASDNSADGTRRRPAAVWWGLGLLTALWAVAAFCLPEASYLVFPLFFVQLHVAGARVGTGLVLASTACAIAALGVQQGFSLPAAIGPLLGAAVALLIGLGYRGFARQAAASQELLEQLLATRDELAASERRAGEEAERSRLAGDIHDTVSQSLSSIQMLLHAAQRAPEGEATERLLGIALETAASAQAETRAIVRALTPAPLEAEGLGGALRRLAATDWRHGPELVLDLADDTELDMSRRTALLRLAQGAVGNALRHAHARVITVRFAWEADAAVLNVADDGVGFDPATAPGSESGAGHFGLASMRERVAQFGGSIDIDAAPGRGTSILVRLPAPASTEGEKAPCGS